MLFNKSSLMTVLGLVQVLGITFTAAYPTANIDEGSLEIMKRQPFPDERKNLTFDDILISNEQYCDSKPLPSPYQEYIIKSLLPGANPTRVYNTTQTAKCREHADHQGPFWRAYSLPNVATAGGSLNISRAGPWREGGFGVLSLALGTEKDSEVSADPKAIVRINMDGKSRTNGNIASAEFDFLAPPSTWGNYGPWLIQTTAGFDIGLKEFHVRAEYRWTKSDGTKMVRPVGTLWVDHVQVRVVKLD